MSLSQEIGNLDGIAPLGHALVEFVTAIHPGGTFEREGKSWVYRPDNFVVFDVHYQRANNLTLSLRGAPREFETHADLPLIYGMGRVYARCKIESADQLDAAAYYIRRALELYKRGRSRPALTEVRVEK
jgi:hypothetical protein